jgi:GntR family transcriptional repressor for pyruvate dehydrogenase complex
MIHADTKRQRADRKSRDRGKLSDGTGPLGSLGEGFVREAKLGEQLHRYLTDLIESGKLAGGAKLPTEKQLCERFRISRPVVREALARLRMEGVITSRRGSGSYVSSGKGPTEQPQVQRTDPIPGLQGAAKLTNLLRCFEMRLTLECDAAYYAALRRMDKHLGAMVAAMTEMDNALRTHSLDHAAHFRFHMLIAEATDNPFVVSALQLLERHMEVCMNLLRDLWLIEPDRPVSAGEYRHQDIYEAIRDQQPERASRAMYLHLDEARQEIFGELGAPLPQRGLRAR